MVAVAPAQGGVEGDVKVGGVVPVEATGYVRFYLGLHRLQPGANGGWQRQAGDEGEAVAGGHAVLDG